MPIYEFIPLEPSNPIWDFSDLKLRCRVHASNEQEAKKYLNVQADSNRFNCIGVMSGPLPQYREGAIEVDLSWEDNVTPSNKPATTTWMPLQSTYTDGGAENYMTKLHNALANGGYRQFLRKNLSELGRIAPEKKHPKEWSLITNGTAKPATAVNTIYELMCQYTTQRLDSDLRAQLARNVAIEETNSSSERSEAAHQEGESALWGKSSWGQGTWGGSDDERRPHLEGGVTEPVPVEATPDAGDMEIEGQAPDVVLQPDPLSQRQTVGSPTVEIGVGQRVIRNREKILAEAPAVKEAVQEILGKYESQIPNDPETQEFVSQLESLSHSIDSFVVTLNENPDEAEANEASAGVIEKFLDFIHAFEATKTGDTVIRLAAGTVILTLSRWFADDVPAALTFSLLAVATYPQESKNIASAIASICKIGRKDKN